MVQSLFDNQMEYISTRYKNVIRTTNLKRKQPFKNPYCLWEDLQQTKHLNLIISALFYVLARQLNRPRLWQGLKASLRKLVGQICVLNPMVESETNPRFLAIH